MGEVLFTEEQQRQTELRILHDAELLRSGASVNKLGGVALDDGQLENVMTTRDPLQTSVERLERSARETWLETRLEQVFSDAEDLDSHAKGRAMQAVLGSGLISVRHILVYGREALVTGRNQLGPRFIGVLDNYITANAFGYNWEDHPTLESVVDICGTLDKVPVRVVETLAPQLFNKDGGLFLYSRRGSLRDLLNTPEEDRANLVGQFGGALRQMTPEGLRQASERVFDTARLYAAQFSRIQIQTTY